MKSQAVSLQVMAGVLVDCSFWPEGDGWPTQARFWLEWGSSIAGQSLPAALSCFRVVYSESISTVPHSLLWSGENASVPIAWRTM